MNVTGTVTDKANNPIAAVTVQVVETKKGGLTDVNGKFSIKAENGQTLQFSYIGLKTVTFKLTQSTVNLSIVLEPDKQSLK